MHGRRKSVTSLNEQMGSYSKNNLSNLDLNENINADLETSSTALKTLEMMKICRRRIIFPFNIMLMIIGWRPLSFQNYSSNVARRIISVLNAFFISLIILLVVFSYGYQILTCRFVMSMEDTIMPSNHTNATSKAWKSTTAPPNSCNNLRKLVSCKHIFTTYVIPDIIHFIAYIIGLIHYRFRKNEDIYGLMEKALQYSTSLEQNKKSQYKVTTILTIWMVVALIWVILSAVNHILYDISFSTFSYPFYNNYLCSTNHGVLDKIGKLLFVLDFCGFIITSLVTAVIVLNYTIYCELVQFYIRAINKKIEMRCIKLNVIKNDIHMIGIAIDLINGIIGIMMTLIYIYNFNLFVGGLNMLFNPELKRQNLSMKLTFRTYFVIHLIPLIIIPLLQCVKVNSTTNCFKEWAMHMSVFGYRKEKMKYLDSFLLYTIGYKPKVKLICIPFQLAHLCALIIIAGFVLMALVQAGLLSHLQFIGDL